MWSHNSVPKPTLLFAVLAAALCAQQRPAAAPAKPPLQVQSQSTFSSSTNKDGQIVINIQNVMYQVSGTGVPGRPPEERLLLRVSTRNRQVIDEIGVRSTVTLEAWPLGTDPKLKPIYSASITGTEAETIENAVWVVSRGLEETEWWSVLKLGTAQRLFDTYVPLVHFNISRETVTERYTGLEVPPDDSREARLRDPHVVGVLEYASEDEVIREALLTCDDEKRAQQLRSYADETRTLTGGAEGLTLAFSQNYPSPPETATVSVPILKDDLDLAHAKLPPGLHIAAFKR